MTDKELNAVTPREDGERVEKKEKKKKFPPTDEQQLAIDLRNKTLLVSASAGAGKTATLANRVIASILDEEAPVRVSDMLIVTFTTAAAAELRERIEEAIRDKLDEEPKDNDPSTLERHSKMQARLREQLLLLPGARISTIDSFCSDILRAGCDQIGINPGFRIAEEAESELIASNILNNLMEDIYASEENVTVTAKELSELSECLCDVKERDQFSLQLMKLYRDLASTVEGVERVKIFADNYGKMAKDPSSSMLWEKMRESLHALARHYLPMLEDFHSSLILIYGTAKRESIRKTVENDIALLKALLAEQDYEPMRRAFTDYPLGKTNGTGGLDPMLPPITPIRRHLTAELKHFTESLMFPTEEELAGAAAGLEGMLDVLYRLLKEFHLRFSEEKKERGICQFSDVLRYTHDCLWQGDERTELAKSQAELYEAIYIDEYQDVNSLQDRVFLAISRDNNRFMVGDIKQSIYRFRSANPGIFAQMKKSLPVLKPKHGADGAYIPYGEGELTEDAYALFMSRNFRCEPGVINFANRIFDRLFAAVADSIGYVDADRLVCGKKSEKELHKEPQVVLVDKAYTPSVKNIPELSALKSATPLVVAKKIRELLDSDESLSYKDIAIIMRSMKGKDVGYAQALAYYGIPSVTADEKSFFMNPEVLVVLCLLNAIDNPRKDVYLAGLMCSPIFGFTADDLAIARRAGGECLYDSLILYSKAKDADPKIGEFLDTLHHYRLLAEGASVDELLARLYHDTGILSMASTPGKKRRLLTLYEHARRFEGGSFRGLYSFICYLNGILDKKNDFDKRQSIPDEDAVRIITAHSSKGLEFPVVFYVEGEQHLRSSRDLTSRLIYDEDYGIGLDLRTESGLAVVENPTRVAINELRHRKNVEEDIRILYVALTRAMEQLYVVATPSTSVDDFLAECEYMKERLDSYSVYNVKSYIGLLMTAGMKPLTPEEFLREMPPFLTTDTEGLTVTEPEDEEDDPEEAERIADELDDKTRVDTGGIDAEELTKRFSFRYNKEHLTKLPEKLSVSRLYPGVLDGTEEEPLRLKISSKAGIKFAPLGKKPEFLSGGKGGKPSPTKRGIATHMLLQFADFAALKRDGAESELERLRQKRYLNDHYAAMVMLDEVEKFRNSELIDRILDAKRVLREQRFNVYLPAARFAEGAELKQRLAQDGEQVLVQGVIDCLYEDAEGRLHLVDYKTDRLTRDELADPAAAKKRLSDDHRVQLTYYSEAVKAMFGRAPATVRVYSLHLGDEIDVDILPDEE